MDHKHNKPGLARQQRRMCVGRRIGWSVDCSRATTAETRVREPVSRSGEREREREIDHRGNCVVAFLHSTTNRRHGTVTEFARPVFPMFLSEASCGDCRNCTVGFFHIPTKSLHETIAGIVSSPFCALPPKGPTTQSRDLHGRFYPRSRGRPREAIERVARSAFSTFPKAFMRPSRKLCRRPFAHDHQQVSWHSHGICGRFSQCS